MNLIRLEKYQPIDFQLFYDLVKQDELMKYISGKGLTELKAFEKFNSILKLNQDPNLGYFKVFINDIFIGDCKLVDYQNEQFLFEIGYLLKKEFWRKGLGSQICKLLLELAEKVDPRKNIVGIIDPENVASKHLLEKFGFESFFNGIENDKNTEKLMLRK